MLTQSFHRSRDAPVGEGSLESSIMGKQLIVVYYNQARILDQLNFVNDVDALCPRGPSPVHASALSLPPSQSSEEPMAPTFIIAPGGVLPPAAVPEVRNFALVQAVWTVVGKLGKWKVRKVMTFRNFEFAVEPHASIGVRNFSFAVEPPRLVRWSFRRRRRRSCGCARRRSSW